MKALDFAHVTPKMYWSGNIPIKSGWSFPILQITLPSSQRSVWLKCDEVHSQPGESSSILHEDINPIRTLPNPRVIAFIDCSMLLKYKQGNANFSEKEKSTECLK